MKAVCQREALLSACQLASVAVASRDVKPILKNLKAIVEPERCTLMATDLELGIRLEVRSVKVEEPGEAILPTAKILSILRESTDEELVLEAGRARLVATDGRRLALAEGPATAHGGHSTKGQMPVVPAKAMSLLERNLQEEDELVRVSLRTNDVLIKTERAMIVSRLVEGRYPDYKRVLPQKAAAKVPLTVGPFHTAVRQAAIMTDEESKRVVFTFAKKKLTLQASGAETGRSKVELPVEYDGKAIDISFDPR